MGFLKKLSKAAGLGQSAPGVPTDPAKVIKVGPTAGDPAARALVQQLLDGQWLPFEGAIAAEMDMRRRDFYLYVAADTFKDRPKWIESWPKVRPDFGPALLLRGMQTTDWAWQARGHERASETSEEAFRVFHERLGLARADLEGATHMLPGDAMPWAQLLPVYMGLGASVADIHWLWGQIRERDPWHPDGAPRVVTALAAKWRGSDEEMFEFVRKAIAYAPDGSTVHECVPYAHYHVFQDRGTRDYFDEPGVKDEIFAAAARSIDLRRGDRDPWLVRARATFAMVYWLAREIDRLREEMVELDNTVCGLWLNFEPPAGYWRGARVEAGLDPDPRTTN